MPEKSSYFLTTAIDYPNSRPHIGTAFEKLGADVQVRFQRMEGKKVTFLMGNDENTIKVARRASELGSDTQEYCDRMAKEFRDVWDRLDISYDDFIQTSEERHHIGCRKFIQKVYDNGYIYKGSYEGLYCEGCEEFKTETAIKDAGGVCPNHKTPPIKRSEPCYFFALSKFRDRLLNFYRDHPDFIQPESRRNEIIAFVEQELLDVNISRTGQKWGIRIPFDEEFTIYVWFDALINYISAIGYGTDETKFREWWPADVHVIGKDITRFHCALWPAMLMAAELPLPKQVFGHGFVYIKGEKISKSMGNVVEPMDLITQFNSEAFRYYFLRECAFPGDGDFSWDRFTTVYNSELVNTLGNINSRVVTLILKNFAGELPETASAVPVPVIADFQVQEFVSEFRKHVEKFQYNQALQKLYEKLLLPINKVIEDKAPWKLVKTDREATRVLLFNIIDYLRIASILLKPFIPRSAEKLYGGFNFAKPWSQLSFADAVQPGKTDGNLKILAEHTDGKIKPMFPRIEEKK